MRQGSYGTGRDLADQARLPGSLLSCVVLTVSSLPSPDLQNPAPTSFCSFFVGRNNATRMHAVR